MSILGTVIGGVEWLGYSVASGTVKDDLLDPILCIVKDDLITLGKLGRNVAADCASSRKQEDLDRQQQVPIPSVKATVNLARETATEIAAIIPEIAQDIATNIPEIAKATEIA